MEKTGQIEQIIMRHSGRGMTELVPYMDPCWCRRAAEEVLTWRKGTVLLATGFYVAGYAETDGPCGTMVLAGALEKLGYHPVVVTDAYCRGFFEPEGIETVYMKITEDAKEQEDEAERILARCRPSGMISVERCGINARGDYENMRGISIRAHTAAVDLLFRKAPASGIPTIGVGDGGNEIGMGNLAQVIGSRLSLVPCTVPCTRLVIATVSNWGAYGITAYLELLSGRSVFPSYERIAGFLERTVELGSVDGVTHERVPHVDGFPESVEEEIVTALTEAVRAGRSGID